MHVNEEEVWAYMGVMILTGINHLPALSDYWKMDSTYRYSPVADRITRDRFFEITRYFHFVDNMTLLPKGVIQDMTSSVRLGPSLIFYQSNSYETIIHTEKIQLMKR